MRYSLVTAPRLLLVVLALAPAERLAAQTPGAPDDEVVARVGGYSITLDELDRAWKETEAASFVRLQQQLYDTRRRALDVLIGEYLLELEAQARGITKDQLVEQELPARITPVTDAEVKSVYERMRNQLGGATLEQMQGQIRTLLERQRPIQARNSFAAELRQASPDVRILLEPVRLEVSTADDDPVRGPADAPVELIEFSDFE